VRTIKVLDLFCGIGGLSYGFAKQGFEVTGVDLLDSAAEAFKLNSIGSFVRADLSKEVIQGDYDIIVGGPPCKPWSLVNTTRRGKAHRDYELLSNFFFHVEFHRPIAFLLENVPPLASEQTLQEHLDALSVQGYSIERRIVTYSDYGAPTSRRRLIVLGIRDGKAATFFTNLLTHARPPSTVRDAIWDLRNKPNGTAPDHVWPVLNTIAKYREYYKKGKFGWYILKWNEPAPSFGNVMKTYILHPDSFVKKRTRVISVREALRIMGFGARFHLPKTGLMARYQMVVDSVSPSFSSAAACVLKKQLETPRQELS
jgi:DNA (cytosine-5)-methyltransferase 1